MSNPILLFGLFDTAIMTARCFRGTEILVFGMDYQTKNLGFYSNMIHPIETPDPKIDEDEWVNFVLRWLEKQKRKFIIIPTSDEFVFLCSKHLKVLSQFCLSVFPAHDILSKIIERDQQFNSVISCGIRVPPFVYNNLKLNELSKLGIKYPFAIKPVNVIEWKRNYSHKGFVVYNEREFVKAKFELSQKPETEFLVQNIIEGDNTSNYEVNALYLPDGRLFKHTIRKIRQYPDGFGTATCIESFLNPEIEKLAEQIIIKMKLFGFSNIEFKYNSLDGNYYYIETNTRVWLQVNFSMKLGINFPLLYYWFLSSEELHDMSEIKEQGKWVDFLTDMLFYKKYRKKYSLSLVKFITSWFPIKSTCLLSLRDPTPFLKELNLLSRIRAVCK